MEGLDRSAETVAKLLLNEKTRGERQFSACYRTENQRCMRGSSVLVYRLLISGLGRSSRLLLAKS
jgi:hypothetical protein